MDFHYDQWFGVLTNPTNTFNLGEVEKHLCLMVLADNYAINRKSQKEARFVHFAKVVFPRFLRSRIFENLNGEMEPFYKDPRLRQQIFRLQVYEY